MSEYYQGGEDNGYASNLYGGGRRYPLDWLEMLRASSIGPIRFFEPVEHYGGPSYVAIIRHDLASGKQLTQPKGRVTIVETYDESQSGQVREESS